MTAHKPNLWISLEGNIGAGKSTLLQNLAKKYPYLITHPEPVESFAHFVDADYKTWDPLAEMYSDPIANTVTTQKLLMKINAKKYQDVGFVAKRAVVTDRHFDSCLNFIKYGTTSKTISPFAAAALNSEFREHQRKLTRKSPDILVYLGTPPKICLDRIKRRQRSSECQSETDLNITRLNHLHEIFRADYLQRKSFEELVPGSQKVFWLEIPEDEDFDENKVLTAFETFLENNSIDFSIYTSSQWESSPADRLGMVPHIYPCHHYARNLSASRPKPECFVANNGYVLAVDGYRVKPFLHGSRSQDELRKLVTWIQTQPRTECD
jgi:deoxyadenosine/deoxycytidine kinase